jgi:isoleucyl-tRNA synthetase
LWNVYSFYATYASVDGFTPEKNPLDFKSLTILDRWIISKTHQLLETAESSLKDYRVDLFMKSFELYLEELSNWYIRRNRRRFWKSEDDQDKNNAYATLYHILSLSIKSVAPVLPFISEYIYQNLIRNSEDSAPESVHLCDYPQPNNELIDIQLINSVDSLKKCVELGRSARSQSNIKIRQPLEKVFYALENNTVAEFFEKNKNIIIDELNVKSIERITEKDDLIKYAIKPNLRTLGKKYGKGLTEIKELLNKNNPSKLVLLLQSDGEIILKGGEYVLHKEDVFIDTEATSGFAAASDSGITVGLQIELTEDLILEGIVRDIVRKVQSMRKNAGYAVQDRIKVSWDFDGEILKAVTKFKDYFCTETLTKDISSSLSDEDYSEKYEVDKKTYLLKVKKAQGEF